MYYQAQDEKRADEFFRQKIREAGNPTRKHSDEPLEEHSFRVARRASSILSILEPDPDSQLQRVVRIAAKGHDWIEDFNISKREIADHLAYDMAERIGRMTTPPLPELAKQSPHITSKFIALPVNQGNIEGYFDAAIHELKQHKPRQYTDLKSALVMKFKLNAAHKSYEFEEILIKSVDGADSPNSYVNDIYDGRIIVRAGQSISTPEKWNGKEPEILTTSAAARKIRERSQVQKALMARLYEVKAEVCARGQGRLSPERYDLMAAHLQSYFDAAVSDLREVVQNPPAPKVPGKTPPKPFASRYIAA